MVKDHLCPVPTSPLPQPITMQPASPSQLNHQYFLLLWTGPSPFLYDISRQLLVQFEPEKWDIMERCFLASFDETCRYPWWAPRVRLCRSSQSGSSHSGSHFPGFPSFKHHSLRTPVTPVTMVTKESSFSVRLSLPPDILDSHDKH